EAFHQARRVGANQSECDIDLVAPYGHEELLGREGRELGGEPGVDRREVGAVDAQARAGRRVQRAPLRVDVEEVRRERVDIGQRGRYAVPIDFAPPAFSRGRVRCVQDAAQGSAELGQLVRDRQAVAQRLEQREGGRGRRGWGRGGGRRRHGGGCLVAAAPSRDG